MNNDRRALALYTAELLRTLPAKISRRTSKVMETRIEKLIATEQRVAKRMEPYQKDEQTVENYRLSLECISRLETALGCLLDGNTSEAADLLELVSIDPAKA